jgi:hypothetical protein
MEKFYIVSIKHTRQGDEFITLWRPNSRGYCWFKQDAGTYDLSEIGYYDNDGNFSISEEKANSLFSEVEYEGQKKLGIKNNIFTRKLLGIKNDKGTYVRADKQLM